MLALSVEHATIMDATTAGTVLDAIPSDRLFQH